MSDDLEPLEPREAMEMWLDRQRSERSDQSLQSYRYRLEQFVDWCEHGGIDNLNDLTPRDVYRFDSECRAEDLAQSTLNNRLGTVKRLLQFCESLNAVQDELAEALEIPELTKAGRVNAEKLSSQRAVQILDWLETYRYASRDHALLLLAWHTAMRMGDLRALDLPDCFLEPKDFDRLHHYPEFDAAYVEEVREEVETPFLFVRHRPDQDTPLKNAQGGQRPVALTQDVADVLAAYVDVNRAETTDEFGRQPLFTTERGDRMSRGAIRRTCYILTQPCRRGEECPHGRDTEDCEALEHGYESRCPSARSPHPVRTGSITDHRDRGWAPSDLAERVNASPEVIREHYDQPQLLRRMQSRRSYLDNDNDNDQ